MEITESGIIPQEILRIISVGIISLMIIYEFIDFKKSGWDEYINDPWNLNDNLLIGIYALYLFSTPIEHDRDGDFIKTLKLLIVLTSFVKLCFLIRIFTKLSFLGQMLM
jgi:hypothetical protein